MNALVWVIRVSLQLYAERVTQIRHPALKQAHRVRYLLWTGVLAFMLCALFVESASAAANFTLFDSMVDDTRTQSHGWFTAITAIIKPTFIILGTIEICWAAAIWAFEKDSLSSLAVEMIKKFMTIGFFATLLEFAPEWIPAIADTFQEVGEGVIGRRALTTDEIISLGLDVIGALWKDLVPSALVSLLMPFGLWSNVIRISLTTLTSVVIAIAFAVVAAQFFTLKVESYILFAAGAIFLGFGSTTWTREYVSKYLNYTISVGVRLLVLILILSITLKAIGDMGTSYYFDYKPLLGVTAAAVLQAILAIKAPEMAGALLSGSVGLSAGSAMGAARAVGGAVAASAGSAVQVAQGLSNLGKAVSAGRSLAKQEGKTGAAAAVSGLSKAIGATLTQAPRSTIDAIKGKGKQEGGHRSGMFARAKHDLRGKLDEGADGSKGSARLGNSSGQGSGARLGSAVLAGNGHGGSGAANGDGKNGAVGKAKASGSGGAAASQNGVTSGAASFTPSDVKEFYAPKAGESADAQAGMELDPPPPYSPRVSKPGDENR